MSIHVRSAVRGKKVTSKVTRAWIVSSTTLCYVLDDIFPCLQVLRAEVGGRDHAWPPRLHLGPMAMSTAKRSVQPIFAD